MPKEGLDRRTYRTAKFGSWEHSQALDAQVAAVGREVGITFRHDLMARTPNTFDAHRLIWLAGWEGKQDELVEALFAPTSPRAATSARFPFWPTSLLRLV
jgi:predicted DsbA family dithiol-disulfide isomerase